MKKRRKFTGLVDPLGRPISRYAGKRKGFRKNAPHRSPCKHESCTPEFDEEAAQGMDEYEIKERWPRFDGTCPDCGGLVIAYASPMHYIMGDW